MPTETERNFHGAMLGIYRRAKAEAGYNATRFLGRSLERVREQINERAKRKKSTPAPADQFLVTLVGSCLFPFVAQPMIAEALGLGPKELRDFMKRRRAELPALLKRTR